MTNKQLVDLFRVVDRQELNWIWNSEWKRFPPRREQEPVFIVLKYEQYAAAVASDFCSVLGTLEQAWVVRFQVPDAVLKDLLLRQADGLQSDQYWVSDEQHEQFNNQIVGRVQTIGGFGRAAEDSR